MRALTLAILVLAGACGTDAPPATFTEIYPLMFPVQTRPQCNFCHSLPPNDVSNGLLSMGSDQASAYTALMATSMGSKCGTAMPLVEAGNPEGSLFYLKLDGAPPCGDPMPLGGTPLPADVLDKVHSWIAAGAKDD